MSTIYITGTDTSVLSAAVASGYYFLNPVDNSSNYYSLTANGSELQKGLVYSQYLTGSTFDMDELVYKRITTYNQSSSAVSIDRYYSEFNSISFNLSGIDDSDNAIVKILFDPKDGSQLVVDSFNNALTYDGEYVYKSASGVNTDNPKYNIFTHKYNLSIDDQFSKSFYPSFSAYRLDGLVDIYNIDLSIARDSIYNASDDIKLLDTTILPLSANDPLIKVELQNPDSVDNWVLRRSVTPTPTRTLTPTPTRNATPTRSRTPTQTKTPTRTSTITRTRSQTPTPTRTKTNTRTRSQTPTRFATPTQTRTRTKTDYRKTVIPLTPPPSKSKVILPPCVNRKYRVTFSGEADMVDIKTVTLGVQYKFRNITRFFLDTSNLPPTTYGNNLTFDVVVPSSVSQSMLSPFVRFTEEDPQITFHSIELIDPCPVNVPDPRIPEPCPEGETLIDGKCQKVCPDGQLMDENGNCYICGNPECPDCSDDCGKNCEQPFIEDANGNCICPPGTTLVNGSCQLLCPPGTTYNADTGLCEEPVCEEGYIKNEAGECEKIITQQDYTHWFSFGTSFIRGRGTCPIDTFDAASIKDNYVEVNGKQFAAVAADFCQATVNVSYQVIKTQLSQSEVESNYINDKTTGAPIPFCPTGPQSGISQLAKGQVSGIYYNQDIWDPETNIIYNPTLPVPQNGHNIYVNITDDRDTINNFNYFVWFKVKISYGCEEPYLTEWEALGNNSCNKLKEVLFCKSLEADNPEAFANDRICQDLVEYDEMKFDHIPNCPSCREEYNLVRPLEDLSTIFEKPFAYIITRVS